MTVGYWYANGRYLMNPGVSGAFTWNGSTTNYALYAALVDSSKYTPNPYADEYLSTAIATADYVIYPANASYPLSWIVNPSQTMTAGLIIFYWDLNVKNSLVSPLTAYAPSGTNNTYDTTSPLIGYGPFVDSSSGNNYWTTTTLSQLVAYTYDTSFTGYSTILSSQVL